jgi:hypothetical protein
MDGEKSLNDQQLKREIAFPTVDFRIAVIREQATDAQLKYVDDH